MGHLASQFGTEASVITYRINRMERRGLVLRTRRESNRREVLADHQGWRSTLRSYELWSKLAASANTSSTMFHDATCPRSPTLSDMCTARKGKATDTLDGALKHSQRSPAEAR